MTQDATLTDRGRPARLPRPWVAWALATLAWALAIAGPLLALRGGEALALGEAIEFGSFAALTFGTIGALIAARHPRNPIGWIFLAVGLLEALAEFAGQYARLGLTPIIIRARESPLRVTSKTSLRVCLALWASAQTSLSSWFCVRRSSLTAVDVDRSGQDVGVRLVPSTSLSRDPPVLRHRGSDPLDGSEA